MEVTESKSSTGNKRPPLRTLYERDPDLAEPEFREMRDIGCNTDVYLPVATVDTGCQTGEAPMPAAFNPLDQLSHRPKPQASGVPFPDWLDSALVSTELERGRESRLRQYIERFRYSAVNAHMDHRRAFGFQTTPETPSPSAPGGLGKRVQYERQTKIQANDKIKRYCSTFFILLSSFSANSN